MNNYNLKINEITKLIESKQYFSQRSSRCLMEEIIDLNGTINREFKTLKDNLCSKTIENKYIKIKGIKVRKKLDIISSRFNKEEKYKEACGVKGWSNKILGEISTERFEHIDDTLNVTEKYNIKVSLFE